MKRAFVSVLFVLCFPLSSSGQSAGFGIGIVAGEPTGISAKQWVTHSNAFDVGLAWAFRRDGFFHVHADYLWHFPGSVPSAEQFVPYAGVGGRFGARKKEPLLGLRIVGGLAWWPKNAPIDVFVEIAPILDLAPATELSGNGGIGIRFFFR